MPADFAAPAPATGPGTLPPPPQFGPPAEPAYPTPSGPSAGSGFPVAPGDPANPPPWTPPPFGEQPQPFGEQDRFNAFRPEEPAAPSEPEAPAPQVRNGRVLFLVLTAAVLILAIPLGVLTLVGKIGDKSNSPAFNPAVGSCVKESDGEAVPAKCEEPGAYQVLSKVDKDSECVKPYIEVSGPGGKKEFLCLGPPAADGDDPGKDEANTDG